MFCYTDRRIIFGTDCLNRSQLCDKITWRKCFTYIDIIFKIKRSKIFCHNFLTENGTVENFDTVVISCDLYGDFSAIIWMEWLNEMISLLKLSFDAK